MFAVAVVEVIVELFLVNFFLVIKGFFLIFFLRLLMAP